MMYAVIDYMNAGEGDLEQRESMYVRGDLCRDGVEAYMNHRQDRKIRRRLQSVPRQRLG